jgi:hypothetical protein
MIPGGVIQLFEPFGRDETLEPEGAIPIFDDSDGVHGSFAANFRNFIRVRMGNAPVITTLERNAAIYIRNIRPDSRIQLDMSLNKEQRLIDDVFIFRTFQEHFLVRCEHDWYPDQVLSCLEGFVIALKTPGVLTASKLHAVWLAPKDQAGQWINSERRAAVEKALTYYEINYGSSHYLQEATGRDYRPEIEVRTTNITNPLKALDEQGYPWILKTWNGLGYWTPWNDETGQAIQIGTEETDDDQFEPQLVSQGPVFAMPTFGDGVLIPNAGVPLPAQFTQSYPADLLPERDK